MEENIAIKNLKRVNMGIIKFVMLAIVRIYCWEKDYIESYFSCSSLLSVSVNELITPFAPRC